MPELRADEMHQVQLSSMHYEGQDAKCRNSENITRIRCASFLCNIMCIVATKSTPYFLPSFKLIWDIVNT